jgi:hypothetical protein
MQLIRSDASLALVLLNASAFFMSFGRLPAGYFLGRAQMEIHPTGRQLLIMLMQCDRMSTSVGPALGCTMNVLG